MATKKGFNVEADAKEFNRVNDRLRRLTGQPIMKVLKTRMQRVLTLSCNRAKVPSIGAIEQTVSGRYSTRPISGTQEGGKRVLSWKTLSKRGRRGSTKTKAGKPQKVAPKGSSKSQRQLIAIWDGGEYKWIPAVNAQLLGELAGPAAASLSEQQSLYKKRVEVSKKARGLGPRQFIEMGKRVGVRVVPKAAFRGNANYRGRTYAHLARGKTQNKPQEEQFLEVRTSSRAAVAQQKVLEGAIRGINAQFRRELNKAKTNEVAAVIRKHAGAVTLR